MPKFSKRIKKCKGAKKEPVTVKEEDSGNLNIAIIPTSEDNIKDEDSAFGGNNMYDDLLRTLASGRGLVAAAFQKRKREEEGHSESENDSSGSSEHDDEGNGKESPSSSDDDDRDGTANPRLAENVEDSGIDDEEIGLSDSDEEHDLSIKEESIDEASSSSSIFFCQWGHKVSEREVAELSRKKWSYKWEVPAHVSQHCRWKGTGECFKEIDVKLSYGLKPRLYNHWLDICNGSGCTDFHSSKQRSFFSLCRSYRDILHHNKKPFYLRGQEDDSKIMDAYLMHSLNHILTSRDLVAKNDTKWASLQESSKGDILDSDNFRDQGFTRPKILILLPLASIAYRVVKRLIQLTPAKHKVVIEHLDRFNKEFGRGIVEDNDKDDIDSSEPKKSSKPVDFRALFGGNNDDHFMIGIKYMGKKVKLYSDFYSSDMIVASPLGLITKIGEMELGKGKDVNYLSSIEVLIVDHADVILMQNWSHVNTVVMHLNQIPTKNTADIMRLRQWYLDGQAQFYRQTIILGSHLNPDIIGLFNHQCLNYRGKIMLACEFRGVLQKIILPVRQTYQRFSAESISDVDDARFEFFTQKVFPKIKDSLQGGIMLFASSYFEFVRLRNFLKSQEASFCLIGDYTKQSDISRARVWFFNGTRKILLYTERAHFYHRYKVARHPDAVTVVTGIVGCAGLKPTVAAIEAGKDIALANKETLIAGGPFVLPLAQKHKVKILPADSEHSAIFQCIQGLPEGALRRVILTASGGSFRDWPVERLKEVKVADALKHPNWNMGKKITVDSATLFNKGLEVIEAHYLFGADYDNIDIVIHPQSIIHSMIETQDSSVLAQLGWPDMRLPILYTLSWPDRIYCSEITWPRLDLCKLGSLTFKAPDNVKYPSMELAYAAGRAGGTMTGVLSAANEKAVELFIDEKISYLDIFSVVERTCEKHQAELVSSPSLEEIIHYDLWARDYAASLQPTSVKSPALV